MGRWEELHGVFGVGVGIVAYLWHEWKRKTWLRNPCQVHQHMLHRLFKHVHLQSVDGNILATLKCEIVHREQVLGPRKIVSIRARNPSSRRSPCVFKIMVSQRGI